MTDIAAGAGPIVPTEIERAVRRSWLGEILFKTFGRTGARIGAAWICLLAFLAVFAPLIANSHPILMKMDGHISSPLLKNLTPADVTLLAMTTIGCVLLCVRRIKPKVRWWTFFIALVIVIPAAVHFIRPPLTVWLGQYRYWQEEGRIEWMLQTPVKYSPTELIPADPDAPHPLAPSAAHWLGTERNGKDILSMVIHACRIAMAVGFISTGIGLIIGVIIGGFMGYFAGVLDLLGMRLVEIFGSIPQLYLLLTFVAFFPRNLYLIMVIIGLTSWDGDARFVRAEFLRLRGEDFVQAARAAGLPLRSILFRHLLPNALAPLLVSVSFGVASAILAEASLSFLGVGLVVEPSWGQLLNQAVSGGGGFYWWLATFPGVAIFMTVFAYNLIGESLRDALDPRMQK